MELVSTRRNRRFWEGFRRNSAARAPAGRILFRFARGAHCGRENCRAGSFRSLERAHRSRTTRSRTPMWSVFPFAKTGLISSRAKEISTGHFSTRRWRRLPPSGKGILLRINTQAGKPAWVTAAIEEAGGIFFTFDDDGVPTTIPVFWDPTFLAKKKAMITALGAHFTNNPTVQIVVASFANATSEDWTVPHTAPDNCGLVRGRLHDGKNVGCREADHRRDDGRFPESIRDPCHRRERSCRRHRQPRSDRDLRGGKCHRDRARRRGPGD